VSPIEGTTANSTIATGTPRTPDKVSTTNTSTLTTTTPPMTMITPCSGNKSLTTPPSDTSSVESPSLVVGDLYSDNIIKPVARQ